MSDTKLNYWIRMNDRLGNKNAVCHGNVQMLNKIHSSAVLLCIKYVETFSVHVVSTFNFYSVCIVVFTIVHVYMKNLLAIAIHTWFGQAISLLYLFCLWNWKQTTYWTLYRWSFFRKKKLIPDIVSAMLTTARIEYWPRESKMNY